MKKQKSNKKRVKPMKIGFEEHIELICTCQQHEEIPWDTFEGINSRSDVSVDFRWRAWRTDWASCHTCGRVVDLPTLRVIGYRNGYALSLEERREIEENVKRFGIPKR